MTTYAPYTFSDKVRTKNSSGTRIKRGVYRMSPLAGTAAAAAAAAAMRFSFGLSARSRHTRGAGTRGRVVMRARGGDHLCPVHPFAHSSGRATAAERIARFIDLARVVAPRPHIYVPNAAIYLHTHTHARARTHSHTHPHAVQKVRQRSTRVRKFRLLHPFSPRPSARRRHPIGRRGTRGEDAGAWTAAGVCTCERINYANYTRPRGRIAN